MLRLASANDQSLFSSAQAPLLRYAELTRRLVLKVGSGVLDHTRCCSIVIQRHLTGVHDRLCVQTT